MAEQVVPGGGATAAYLDQVDIDGDRELVDRFQRGDDTAFAELYSRHYRRLFRTCLRFLGDPATAEDAAQEAFAKAFRALPTLNGDRRFYPWLSVIAKRVCVDIHRQRARSQPAESIDPGATADGEQAVLTSMDAAAVQDAVARLTSRHRDVLHLREYEGWSYRRIATHYGVRLAAVETLLWRARRALHRQLTMAGYERPALVSLPVAGWAYRRLGSMRARIEEWGGHRLAPVVGSAASVLAIGALVIGATGSGVHARRPQPLIASHGPSAAPGASAACRALHSRHNRPVRPRCLGQSPRCAWRPADSQPDRGRRTSSRPRGDIHQRQRRLAAGSSGARARQRRWRHRRHQSDSDSLGPGQHRRHHRQSTAKEHPVIRRTLLAAPIVLMALGLGSASLDLAAPAGASTPPPVRVAATGSPWFCIAIAEINFGYCQYNPLS